MQGEVGDNNVLHGISVRGPVLRSSHLASLGSPCSNALCDCEENWCVRSLHATDCTTVLRVSASTTTSDKFDGVRDVIKRIVNVCVPHTMRNFVKLAFTGRFYANLFKFVLNFRRSKHAERT